MGVFKAIFDLLGLSKGEPVPSVPVDPGAAPAPIEDDDGGDEDSTRDGQLDIEEEWAELQMLIHRCEAESLDLAGMDIADPKTFWARQAKISQGQADGKTYLHSVISAGFRGVEHWEQVSRYYQAKWSQLVRLPHGEREIRPRDEFTAAAGGALTSQPAVDPRLLEPVRGVSLEQWARAAAAVSRLSAHAEPAEVEAALAAHRLDRPTFDAVNAAWQDRMQRDRSLTIAARFGAAVEADAG